MLLLLSFGGRGLGGACIIMIIKQVFIQQAFHTEGVIYVSAAAAFSGSSFHSLTVLGRNRSCLYTVGGTAVVGVLRRSRLVYGASTADLHQVHGFNTQLNCRFCLLPPPPTPLPLSHHTSIQTFEEKGELMKRIPNLSPSALKPGVFTTSKEGDKVGGFHPPTLDGYPPPPPPSHPTPALCTSSHLFASWPNLPTPASALIPDTQASARPVANESQCSEWRDGWSCSLGRSPGEMMRESDARTSGRDARVGRQGVGGYSQPFSRLSDSCPAPCDKWIIFVAYCNFLRTAPWAVSRRRCTEGILMPDFVLGRLNCWWS